SFDSESQYSFHGLSYEELQEWKEKYLSNTDPNDADIIKLTEAVNKYESILKSRSGSTDSSVDLMKEFSFGTKQDIENSLRLKMLMLRAQGVPHLKGVQVPMYDREVNVHLLEGSKTKNLQMSSKGIEAKRSQGLEILSQLREHLIKQSQGTSDRRQTWEDMIIEEASSKLEFGINLFSPLENKRPLHPRRKERKKISGSVANNLDIKLIVTIMYALNVPIRRETQENTSPRPSLVNELGELITANTIFTDINYSTRVAPFVEVCFQRQTARTNTADGPQPTWNETLSLKFRAPNDDISPSSLITMTDFVYLNLFDEVVIKEESTAGERLERRWLGSLKIPISTLYLNSKVDGTFCLSTPPVLLGYEYDSKLWNLGSNDVNGTNIQNTYLTLFLTIDPTLQLPEPLALKCESNEDEDVLHQAQKWESETSKNFNDRSFKALAIDLSGKFVVVSRYLRPLKPPDDMIQNLSATEEVMQRLARFVSLIPFVSDNMALPGFGDVWCTSSEFLEMLIGDEEEHAILLCNFFLYLGKRAGIVLGTGIPEGMTSYVIVWEYTGQEPSVWNPSTGVKYSVRDVYLPLNNIGCIFTAENVYANIQDHTHPIDLNYDVTKSSFWSPLFTKKFPNPGLQSVQVNNQIALCNNYPEALNYSLVDQEYVQNLENKLEKHLRESLMRWRKKSRTFFNRKCIQQIRKILPRLEKKIGKLQQNDLIQDLEDVLIVHQMTGFPLNMPFLDIESVTEAVYATGVHLIDDKKVDFALAVYIHPYPCNVLSVWVYIAALYKI
ncbi:coiled-coil and C2 domain-containing protein 2A-like protein, partial [Leptotrombidium deliense]